MIEEQRRRVEEYSNEMMEKIDKSYLRKIQSDMHKCAAVCCDNEMYSIQKVHNCVENCSSALNNAQKYVEGEFERATNRLKRCIMDCNDKIIDKMGPKPTQSEVDRYKEEFETCAIKCVNSYRDMLPILEKTIRKGLSNKKYE